MTTLSADKIITPAEIPLCEPQFAGNEWAYIKSCLDDNWVSSVGPFVNRFEAQCAQIAGTSYGVATVNGTAALHAALLVAGVQSGEEVITSSLTFIATANAIRYIGAAPVFIDAEPTYWQMNVQLLEDFLQEECVVTSQGCLNRKSGRLVRAIVPVHVHGHPVDMDRLMELAASYRLIVIEDATEALGSSYSDKPAGGIGHIGCFSFNGNKLITTGGGGMIVTNDPALAQAAKHLTTQAKCGNAEYIHDQLGYNYRMPNILAALGCAQLEQLDAFIRRKRSIAARYNEFFANHLGFTPQGTAPKAISNCWLYAVRVDRAKTGFSARELISRLAQKGIQSRPLWQPMHLSQVHKDYQFVGTGVASDLYENVVSLPCSTGLSNAQQDQVLSVIEAILEQ